MFTCFRNRHKIREIQIEKVLVKKQIMKTLLMLTGTIQSAKLLAVSEPR